MAPKAGGTNLIDEHEAAALLGLSVRTLRKWRLVGSPGGRLPFRKLGRCVRYALEDVEALVDASLRRSTSDPGPMATKGPQ